MPLRKVLFALLLILTTRMPVWAQSNVCGLPPQLPDKLQTDESIKGQLQGQAQVLSRLLGKADLAGKIQASRKEIYQSSDKYFAAKKDAYLAYVFCILVMKDTSSTLNDKLDALMQFRRPIGAIPTVKEALSKSLALAVEVQVPAPGNDRDARFLRDVGQVVTYTLKNFDPRSGRGEIAAMSFGYPNNGYVSASDTNLSIVNSAAMGCTGSFRRTEKGILEGRLSCKWGNPYPTYNATINLGG